MKPITAMKGISQLPSAELARARLKGSQRRKALPKSNQPHPLKLTDLKSSGHWPTLLTAFLYFDFSFMVWTVLGPLGAQIGEALHLSPEQKGLMVAVPILSGAFLRILLGLLTDRIGTKNTGIVAQIIVMAGLFVAWRTGLPNFAAA